MFHNNAESIQNIKLCAYTFTPKVLATSSVLVINVPPKIWRPRMRSSYRPPADSNNLQDIDDSIFYFEKLGKCVIKHKQKFRESDRNDIILYNDSKHEEELNSNFKIGKSASVNLEQRIKRIIKKYWDSFCTDGARRPILGYEFSINTGTHTPVCK